MKYYMKRHKTEGKTCKTTFSCECTQDDGKVASDRTELSFSTTWRNEVPTTGEWLRTEDTVEELTREEIIDEIGLHAVCVLEVGGEEIDL